MLENKLESKNVFYQWLYGVPSFESNNCNSVALTLAPESQSNQDNCNNSNFSALTSQAFSALEKELQILNEKYEACIKLRFRPDYETFSDCTLKHEAMAFERMNKRINEIEQLLTQSKVERSN
ncbi:MAG: hypothetical protein K2X66_09285 [Cyanobacteria bacterium]|nr:hypothetical protein [Cyanobacteriota bacterium]